ncbi:hypothetical protein Pcinc_019626 [Petrolisthes cinctipes]|uniref:Uncharacterized protein n=1 Tax=Petrolisthes cinctipes TaxID=88211 RepID=A0AAE1FLR7_PETCI|nr:hypothetical protein Pcinc_019626 [Petrolisthes cinctipes]
MLISDDQLKQWWCEGGKLIQRYSTTSFEYTVIFSAELWSRGQRTFAVCCPLFIHPSIYSNSNSTSITSYCLQ